MAWQKELNENDDLYFAYGLNIPVIRKDLEWVYGKNYAKRLTMTRLIELAPEITYTMNSVIDTTLINPSDAFHRFGSPVGFLFKAPVQNVQRTAIGTASGNRHEFANSKEYSDQFQKSVIINPELHKEYLKLKADFMERMDELKKQKHTKYKGRQLSYQNAMNELLDEKPTIWNFFGTRQILAKDEVQFCLRRGTVHLPQHMMRVAACNGDHIVSFAPRTRNDEGEYSLELKGFYLANYDEGFKHLVEDLPIHYAYDTVIELGQKLNLPVIDFRSNKN